MSYIGRFAPSPSGPLHFGSLVAALGSYFQAKSQDGKWLIRIEDIDPPREVDGATQLILEALNAYGLVSDAPIVYQSECYQRYQEQIDLWLHHGQAYYCQCTRKQIKASGGFYQGVCRQKQLNSGAIRLVMNHPVTQFTDIKHGTISLPTALANEDFIIKRRDGLFAYNLAVVLDDIAQGITEVVRGADLIEPTGRQISLYHQLGHQPVSYLHLPLAMDENGNKLSKQNHATAINVSAPKPTLLAAMAFLGFTITPSLEQQSIDAIIKWGVENWHIDQLPAKTEATPRFSNGSL